jgi:hypothetical protein
MTSASRLVDAQEVVEASRHGGHRHVLDVDTEARCLGERAREEAPAEFAAPSRVRGRRQPASLTGEKLIGHGECHRLGEAENADKLKSGRPSNEAERAEVLGRNDHSGDTYSDAHEDGRRVRRVLDNGPPNRGQQRKHQQIVQLHQPFWSTIANNRRWQSVR